MRVVIDVIALLTALVVLATAIINLLAAKEKTSHKD